MAFSIQTNINSLIAQENLRVNSEFQSRTIQRLTSGYRINQSGDDAAGLAIANKFRSDVAELTQGVRNANDGISSLQIVDGGMNNISKMLDRLKTLATQSASGTFTGDRNVLNNEFNTLLSEIDRQAQAIGLDSGGTLAKSLSVFIGGGRQHGTNLVSTDNGSVMLDLAQSAVDTRSLGLKGMQAVAGTADLGNASATSVANILADVANTTATSGYADFYFSGAGFSGAEKVKVSVNLQGVGDVDSLATAINAAITAAASGTSPAATAFKKANIVASVNTDVSGGKQLAFTSSTAAFQVQAGDKMANALMGNLASGTTGEAVATTVAGVATTAGAFVPTNVTVRISGGGLNDAVDLTFDAGSTTTALAISDLISKVSSNAALQAAGITVSGAAGEALVFTSARGETLNVMVTGDTANALGFGSFVAGAAGAVEYTSIQGAAYAGTGTGDAVLEFSFNGGLSAANSITLALDDTAIADVVQMLNAEFATNATFQGAGLKAEEAGGQITISSTNGTHFRVNAGGSTVDIGFGTAGATFDTLTVGTSAASSVNSGGATHTGALSFTALSYGTADQSVMISAVDAGGVLRSTTITLQNDSTAQTGRSLDEAIAHINAQLQKTNDPTLQQIVAVKENVGGTEKINFISSLRSFSVSVGTSAAGQGIGGGAAATYASTDYGTASSLAINSLEGALSAVSALSIAVETMGIAQAAVGKAQNQLGYALALAQSQISNYSGAESRIRDADVAAEAANLTKAQVLQQASLAAMAQANSAPQAVLALLRG